MIKGMCIIMIKNSFLKLLSFFIVIAIVVNLLVAFRIIAFEGRGFGIFAIINIIIVYFYFRFKNKEIEK
ncbi:hypothetical protein ACEUUK_03610 [Staphylococcus pseudintermedius]|nr:hypothetical protein [Staphylococcus pseudintermedius]EGQ1655164.1 hypothetical protein [Staphylococcus pseudintermedius]EGQ2871529.1 hypothetical protein [Staphylococcus pseudintermedius]EGQ2964858.1 hypothetical protein [Staphylococcus pseudintermedius]EGQ3239844.1 hypothetical protein [Staphylococcus pseudintermedius]EGQ3402142.1 hypothetical protein [Staphylococcus pseudintermedius]